VDAAARDRPNIPNMLVIGLMSGTSADAVDAALVDWPDPPNVAPWQLVAFRETPLPDELRRRIHRLAAAEVPGPECLEELVALDILLAERFAEATLDLLHESGVPASEVAAIASHGQTVAHHPELRGSLQIGCPSVIAERTGIRVVADFRARDLAVGGEGAPLAPFFHAAVFSAPGENRGVLNLGGIANLTFLPASGRADRVIAFDVGPANALIDSVVELLTNGDERMDRDGERARRGRLDADLLAALLDDDYLRRPPPKSTGRERYGSAEARALVEAWRNERSGQPEDDLIATLVELTCESVAQSCREHLGLSGRDAPLDRLLVGGGGAANPAMMDGLARSLPGVIVERFDDYAVPFQAAEAMAFSLMGRNALLGIPNHLPACTGAKREAVLGEIVPGVVADVSHDRGHD
jgi:anhydro-N-acetylmuramic acid kinase